MIHSVGDGVKNRCGDMIHHILRVNWVRVLYTMTFTFVMLEIFHKLKNITVVSIFTLLLSETRIVEHLFQWLQGTRHRCWGLLLLLLLYLAVVLLNLTTN